MLISYRWLKEWVPGLPGPSELAPRLTARGFNVEGVEPQARFSGVVVGKVVEREKHPNADRLSLCKVDVGGQVLEIVCGAPNARAGITVAVAVDGARLPGGVLKKSKIRGVVSNGMLCSGRELELSGEHEGILELDESFPAGQDFALAAGLDDTLLDVDVAHNRGDALCARGLAREAAAATGLGMQLPFTAAAGSDGPVPGLSAVEIADPADCPRYACRLVDGVKVGPSPAWLSRRLEAHGMRSINNVVDSTNLVLLELGQPIHAFDSARVRGGRLIVRRAAAGESLRTLDGVERVLASDALVIADPEGALALAGLMGGESSEVTTATTSVLLESACFAAARVRQGAKALKLASEAARRFERGTDVEAVREALDRVASLLVEVAGGTLSGGILDSYPGRREARRLRLRGSRVSMVYGAEVGERAAAEMLLGLGFGVTASVTAGVLDVTVPSWRADILEETDLIEEIARSRGYDGIPEDPGSITPLFGRVGDDEKFRESLRSALQALGFHEAMTATMLGPGDLDLALAVEGEALAGVVSLDNPMSRDSSILRPSMAPGLLQALGRNVRRGRADVAMYEIGRCFRKAEGSLPEEWLEVGIVLAGARHASGFGLGSDSVDFFDLKGRLEALLEGMNVDNVHYRAYDGRGFHSGHAAEMLVGDSRIGVMGQLGRKALERLEIPGPVFAATLRVEALRQASRPADDYREWGRFPSVKRDLAFLVNPGVESAALESEIRAAAGPLLKSVRLFDVYTGERIGKGLKSLAYSLEFQSLERTLADGEVDQAVSLAIRRASEQHGAQLRS